MTVDSHQKISDCQPNSQVDNNTQVALNYSEKFRIAGLGFRPMPHLDSIESTLIWYKGTDHKDYRQWTDALDQFLASMYDF